MYFLCEKQFSRSVASQIMRKRPPHMFSEVVQLRPGRSRKGGCHWSVWGFRTDTGAHPSSAQLCEVDVSSMESRRRSFTRSQGFDRTQTQDFWLPADACMLRLHSYSFVQSSPIIVCKRHSRSCWDPEVNEACSLRRGLMSPFHVPVRAGIIPIL